MKKNSLVAVFNSHEEVGAALDILTNQLKIGRDNISVLGKGENGEPKDTFELKKENSDIIFWGEQGALWGGIFGFLAGGFFAFIPGFGPLVAAGPILSSLVGALGGAEVLGSLGALVAWLTDLGMEEVQAHKYADYLKNGKIIILVQSDSKDELENIKKALEKTDAEELKTYSK